MERESTISSASRVVKELIPALAPVVLIWVGYIDPGKWATCIDVGARFGGDLVAFALAFNVVGVLCLHLSGRVSVVTGKNLAKLCSEEYDKLTCFFLGIQAEASVIFLDLTMILGMAYGLNMIFGLNLFTGILLTALNAVLYPLFSPLLEICRVKFLVVCMAGVTIFCYVLGMLTSLPEFTVSSNSLLSKLSGESAFALMGLLGANVMPHNFYLHSSIVQRYHGPGSVSKGAWLQDNFVISLTISGAMFLVNFVLMNLAAGAFYNTGLGLLTFQDAMSLLDQAYRNPILPFASFLVLFLANQIVASSWEFFGEGGETILHDFFNMDLPDWLHRATVRIFAVVTALFCLWHSGADGMYHLLICSQVMMALLLPSSVIPLFRIASCRPLMGQHKISPILEFVVLLTFMGILGLELVFVVEMVFGESDWVGSLRWNIGNATSLSYILILFAACISLFIMLWLAATPLKSSTSRLDSQPWNWDAQEVSPELRSERDNSDVIETRCHEEELLCKEESLPFKERSLHSHPDLPTANYDVNLPDKILGSVNEPYMTVNSEEPVISARIQHEPEQSATSVQSVPVSSVITRDSDDSFPSSSTAVTEPSDPVEKTLRIEGDSQLEKEHEEESTWEPEVLSEEVTVIGLAVTEDGPGSFRSLSGKSDEGGSGVGSLSRLSGLGRAARRQLAATLDDFWSQLYDYHGQITQEAKAKKLDMLLGIDSKPAQSLAKADSAGKEFGMKLKPMGGRLPDNTMKLGLYDSLNQLNLKSNMESAYGAQRGTASLWSNSNQMQLMDACMQNSNRSSLDTTERRYQSLRYPTSSGGLDNQPATVHGYQLASYLNRMAKEDSLEYTYGLLEPTPPKPPSLVPNNYRESLAFALRQQSTNGFNSLQQSSAQSLVKTNNLLQSDNSYYDIPAGPLERMASQNNAKKYHSSPNISGLSVPLRNLYLSERNAQLDSPNRAMGFGATIGRAAYEQSPYSSAGSRAPAPLAFDELSPSRAYHGAMSLRSSSGADPCSLWSRQPFEEFGCANNSSSVGAQVPGDRSTMMTQEPTSVAEMESKLLQSLRHCILKLLKLEGSEWLFRSNDGADEDLIDRVATRERFVYEVESRDFKQVPSLGDPYYAYSESKVGPNIRDDEAVFAHLISSVPNCGEGCVWKADLVVSFGVWCIHRILELSLMESRPELWGKYTYVLNRLQGVIDLAFFKPRTPIAFCFCLQVPASFLRASPPPVSEYMHPAGRPSKGQVTTSAMLSEMIKDVENAISSRRGRSGTAAGDVAFPKGKENLASVLKRYKRRLSNKPVGAQDSGPGSRMLYSSSYGS